MDPEQIQPAPAPEGSDDLAPAMPVEPDPTAPRPAGSSTELHEASPARGLRAGVRPRWMVIVAIPLAILAAGGGAWAYTVQGHVDDTRAAIAAAQRDVSTTSGQIDGTRQSLRDEQKAVADATVDVDRLTSRSEDAAVCISAQAGDSSDVEALVKNQEANYGRTATGSTFAAANVAAWEAFQAAVDDMYNAYKAAEAGNYSSVNSWITKSNSQINVNNDQVTIQTDELTAINQTVSEINGAREALDQRIATTASTCASL